MYNAILKIKYTMQHFISSVALENSQEARGKQEVSMLRLTVSTEEYLMIGDNIKVVFLGGTKNHLRIMIDAPKDVNIVRSSTLEKQITSPDEKAALPRYYAEPETDPRYLKKKRSER